MVKGSSVPARNGLKTLSTFQARFSACFLAGIEEPFTVHETTREASTSCRIRS